MKIGLYKLGIAYSDIDVKNDKNGRFKELLALNKIFRKAGHDVELLDAGTNLIGKHFDRIYILNGALNDGCLWEVDKLRRRADFLGYILTDLRLINENFSSLFDIVYTQAIKPIPFIDAKQLYNGMPELAMYCSNFVPAVLYNKFEDKENLFVFGGGIRDRREDIVKYVLNNNFTYYGKDEETGFDNRVPIKEYYEKLADTKYSILIQDSEYNSNGFITWRYFENIMHGVITFIDRKCDKDNIIKLNPLIKRYLTVSCGEVLKLKINHIEEAKSLRRIILEQQYRLITPEKLSGKFTYECLIRQ